MDGRDPNEDYDENQDPNFEEGKEGVEVEEGAGGDDDDQYFDEAGEIGYLPAEHVTAFLNFLAPNGSNATSIARPTYE